MPSPGSGDSEEPISKTEQMRNPTKEWRPRLYTLKQYEYESDFTESARGHLLVDEKLYRNDWKLWLDLLEYRQRHHGPESVKTIFEQMSQRKLELSTEGHLAQAIWYRFLQAGAQDMPFLDQVIQYASILLKNTRRSWPRLYVTVMTRMVKRDVQIAMYWHKRLKADFPPTLKDYQKLFHLSLESGSTVIFAEIYKNHPIRSMYVTIVPTLCSAQMYNEAFRWHFDLLRTDDLPEEFSAIEPLLNHHAMLNDDRRVEALVKSVLKRSKTIKKPFRKFLSESDFISREIMSRQLGQIHGIAPKQFSDHFCARLFATRIFSIETIINGLEMMGAQSIGHESLREIVSRDDCESDAVCRHLDHLREAGIVLNKSKYSTIIRQAAQGNRQWLLRSIIDCDAHPDTFEDLNLQEEMFTMYLGRGDTVQMERTLATITSEVPPDDLEMQRFNFILRGHMRLRNIHKVVSMLEKMRMMNIPLTPKSSRHVRVQWLSKRRVSRTGYNHVTLTNLILIINVMRQTLESGAALPPEAWREPLRRLGMTGQLAEFRSLALWLADWYTNLPSATDSGASLQRSFDRIAEQKKVGATASQPFRQQAPNLSVPSEPQPLLQLGTGLALYSPLPLRNTQTKSYSRRNHLNQIFTISGQQAIIAWGFQEDAKRPRGPRFKFQTRERRPAWTWGLLLLRQLRERGVPIKKGMVARACRLRLAQLFGIRRRSNRLVNRTARRLNDKFRMPEEQHAQYGAYIREMESIWGEDLFFKSEESSPRRNIELHGETSDRRRDWKILRIIPEE
ncbi:MAG: hypothetical protein Q9164_002584 [Protoblastenia rupestris]